MHERRELVAQVTWDGPAPQSPVNGVQSKYVTQPPLPSQNGMSRGQQSHFKGFHF